MDISSRLIPSKTRSEIWSHNMSEGTIHFNNLSISLEDDTKCSHNWSLKGWEKPAELATFSNTSMLGVPLGSLDILIFFPLLIREQIVICSEQNPPLRLLINLIHKFYWELTVLEAVLVSARPCSHLPPLKWPQTTTTRKTLLKIPELAVGVTHPRGLFQPKRFYGITDQCISCCSITSHPTSWIHSVCPESSVPTTIILLKTVNDFS